MVLGFEDCLPAELLNSALLKEEAVVERSGGALLRRCLYFYNYLCMKVFSRGRRIFSNGQIEERIEALEESHRQARQRLRTVLPATGPINWHGGSHRLPYCTYCIGKLVYAGLNACFVEC